MPNNVLITGSAGRIGSALVEGLQGNFSVRAFDCRPTPGAADSIQGDLGDFELLRQAAAGVDSIIHLAAAPGSRYPWSEVLEKNIVGSYNLYEVARLEKVRRVIYTSTNQVVNGYPPDCETIRWDSLPRPTSYYGVSKVTGEMLGHMYARQHGIEVICIRIGSFNAMPAPDQRRGKYLSKRDCVHLYERALLQPDISYAIVYGMSDNQLGRFDIAYTKQLLNYQPQDSEDGEA